MPYIDGHDCSSVFLVDDFKIKFSEDIDEMCKKYPQIGIKSSNGFGYIEKRKKCIYCNRFTENEDQICSICVSHRCGKCSAIFDNRWTWLTKCPFCNEDKKAVYSIDGDAVFFIKSELIDIEIAIAKDGGCRARIARQDEIIKRGSFHFSRNGFSIRSMSYPENICEVLYICGEHHHDHNWFVPFPHEMMRAVALVKDITRENVEQYNGGN
jgi:hypothetical protein